MDGMLGGESPLAPTVIVRTTVPGVAEIAPCSPCATRCPPIRSLGPTPFMERMGDHGCGAALSYDSVDEYVAESRGRAPRP
jgi:hypothetical protein